MVELLVNNSNPFKICYLIKKLLMNFSKKGSQPKKKQYYNSYTVHCTVN